VVPEGTARLRARISAAHENEHLDKLIDSLKTLKSEVG
jgi:7-keto-8-aminopelargonate synthetase-like enzyme